MTVLCGQEIQAVLFDLDGTLLDSAPDLVAAINTMRIARGLHALPHASLRPFVGTGARGMLDIAFGLQAGAAQFNAMREEFFLSYEQCMGKYSRLFDGVDTMVDLLQGKAIAWGIVTNKSQRFAQPITARDPTLAQAQVLICGDTTAYSKPHPEPLLAAARQLDIPACHCIYVGDDERDIAAARAAGMLTIAANYGYLGGCDTSVHAWQPDAVIHSPLQLAEFLDLQ